MGAAIITYLHKVILSDLHQLNGLLFIGTAFCILYSALLFAAAFASSFISFFIYL
jgi:hypothetical protein